MDNFICRSSSSPSPSSSTCTSRKRWTYCIVGGIIVILIVAAVSVTIFDFGSNAHVLTCSNVTKSPADPRNYCALTLPNQMRVILISDPGTDKSAASLVVGAGFLSDPLEVPGMAHYLEHYLFMGTEKYPTDNQLSQFLAKNGGHSNAFTNDALTGYHFDTSPHSFDEAMDRFSQFFTAPLLSPTKLKGVMSAVDSEFQNARLNDYRRSFQVIRALTNSSHPYSRHHIGNALTLWTRPMELSIDVRSQMVKFFKGHYSGNLMSLVILGRESLDDLSIMVKKYFQSIPNTNVPKPNWTQSPWGPGQLERRIDIVRLVEFTRMDVIFPIPDYTDQYKSKAADYISSLLGQEEPGSILSLLKTKKKWATALSTFLDVPGRGFAMLLINVHLTIEGTRHVEDVVLHIFQYLKLLRQMGPQKWYWDTLAKISATRFKFMDDSAAVGIVRHLARNMQTYPMNEAWSAPYDYSKYQPQLITKLVNILVPSNMVLVTTSKENSKNATHKEPTYGVEYSYQKIDPSIIQKWVNCGLNEELKFPSTNEFLPNVFDIKPNPSKLKNKTSRITPRIILDDEKSRLWFLQDEEFLVPRASINLHIFNPFTSQSPRNRNLQNLLVTFIHAMVKESSYAALEAGLDYEILSKSHGIFISVKGYDDKISKLMDHLLKFLVNSTTLLTENGDRFDIVREIYLKRFDNFKFEKPGVKARDNLVHLMSRQVFSRHELLAAAKDLTVHDVINYATKIFAQVRLEWLIHGNMLENDALALNKMGMKYLKKLASRPMLPSELTGVIHQGVKLPEASNYLFQAEEEKSSESCVLSYLQTENGPENLREERILMMFMDKMLNVPCFNVLRTQENLGYSVACFAFQDDGFWGFQIFVQGENHPDFVQTRIHQFLLSMVPTMNNLTREEFLKYKTAVRTSIIARKPKNLNDRTRFLNWQMEAGTYDFQRGDQDLEKLEEISLQQVVQFFNTWISPEAPRRKVLNVHMISRNVTIKAAPDGWNFKEMVGNGDIDKWKDRLGFNPVQQPYTSIPDWPSPS